MSCLKKLKISGLTIGFRHAELIRLGLGTLNNGQDEQKKLQK